MEFLLIDKNSYFVLFISWPCPSKFNIVEQQGLELCGIATCVQRKVRLCLQCKQDHVRNWTASNCITWRSISLAEIPFPPDYLFVALKVLPCLHLSVSVYCQSNWRPCSRGRIKDCFDIEAHPYWLLEIYEVLNVQIVHDDQRFETGGVSKWEYVAVYHFWFIFY